MHKNLEEKREIVRNYIKNNPAATYRSIRRDTKLKVERLYKNMRAVYEDANVKAPRTLVRFSKGKRKEMIINYIKGNPNTSILDIRENLKINPLFVFRSIKGAFEAANIEYPKLRKEHGVLIYKIKERSNKFEKEIISLLKKFGNVEYQVKTKRGIADALIKIKGKRYVVEIKDYEFNNVGYTEAKQLNKYLEDLNCNKGILVCNIKTKDKIYIGNNEIRVLTKKELLHGNIV